jgi:hypothetical protein
MAIAACLLAAGSYGLAAHIAQRRGPARTASFHAHLTLVNT